MWIARRTAAYDVGTGPMSSFAVVVTRVIRRFAAVAPHNAACDKLGTDNWSVSVRWLARCTPMAV